MGRGPAEITTLLDLHDWPAGMRVIASKERPHQGAQLTLTDTGGHRVTCFSTNDPSSDLPALEARHRQRARCEDRITDAKDTGAGEPALRRCRFQRHLDPVRPARHGPHHLSPATRPPRHLARRTAQDPAAETLRHRRPPHQRRTPPDHRPRPGLAMGRHRPGRPHPTRRTRPTRTRLTPRQAPNRRRPEPRRPPPMPTGQTTTPPRTHPWKIKNPPKSTTPTKWLG